MKRYLLTLIMLLNGTVAFASGYEQLVAKTGYTPDEKAHISALFTKAEEQGLPLDLLANKVKEATTKKVRPTLLLAVMEQRLARMTEADRMLTEKKIQVQNRQYAIQVVTELQEKGATRASFDKMMEVAVNKKKDFDEVAGYFDVLGKYQAEDIAEEYHADILAACIHKGVSPERGERLLYLFTEAKRNNMPLAAAKDLILNGIAQNQRLDEISDTMALRGASGRRLSESGRRELERESERGRDMSGDGYRGKIETGGNDMRRGR